jgi:hypothetical protein
MTETRIINLVGSNGDLVSMQVNETGQVVPFAPTEPTPVSTGTIQAVQGLSSIDKEDAVFFLSIINTFMLVGLLAYVMFKVK